MVASDELPVGGHHEEAFEYAHLRGCQAQGSHFAKIFPKTGLEVIDVFQGFL